MRKDAPQLDRFADKYCLDYIERAVSRFVADNYDKLECRSRVKPQGANLEGIRIEFTTNISTYGNIIGFDAVISADIEIYETRRGTDYSDLITQWFRVPCQVIFEEKIERFRIYDSKVKGGGGIEIYSAGAKSKSPLAATSNLVPVIYGEDYDAEAARFLKKYCPEALETPMPVPLEKIAEQMGIPPINYDKRLSPDFSVFGRICFTDEEIDVYDIDGVPETIQAKRGQIFIDNDTYMLCNVGCLRNTIAHELFHWERHRLYATIKRLLDEPNFKSTRCRVRPQSAAKRKSEELTDEEWIELHANAISPRIIMPIETAKPKAVEILKKYGYNPQNPDEYALRAVIIELADFFQVSKQLATVRLAQFGISLAQELFDLDYERNINCSTQVPHTDILREYQENEGFRAAVNSGLFRYAEGRFVINDAKYIGKADGGIYILTDYAREHLDECALRFETEFSGGDYWGDGLYRKNKAGFALKKYVEDKSVLEAAEISAVSAAGKLEAENYKKFVLAVASGAGFGQSLFNLMKAYFEPLGIQERNYASNFFAVTGISEKLYRDWKNGTSLPTHNNIVAIGAAFDFDIRIVELLLEKAGKAFLMSDEHNAHRIILTACRGWSIFDRNTLLEKMDFSRLTDD